MSYKFEYGGLRRGATLIGNPSKSWPRLTHPTNYELSRLPIPDSRFPIPDSRFPIPDSRFPIPYSLYDHRFSIGNAPGRTTINLVLPLRSTSTSNWAPTSEASTPC
ncbi:MAG: hypothetical protein F6K26_49585 [Moorea sp. SIO2I5]|nr:hypothetical protein [Moorena sp. SIO2I5]